MGLLFYCIVVFLAVYQCSAESLTLSRTIEQSGFHVVLSTTLDAFENANECQIVLVDNFPKEVFVDMDEIREIEQIKLKEGDIKTTLFSEHGIQDSTQFPFVEIEKPAEMSKGFYIVSPLIDNKKNVLPFHARYQASQTGKLPMGKFTVQYPELVCTLCPKSNKTSQQVKSNPCASFFSQAKDFSEMIIDELNIIVPKKSEGFSGKIPVGSFEDKEFVERITLGITMGSAIVLSIIAFTSGS